MTDLLARRSALEADIRNLEIVQGAAILDGQDYDAGPLIAARDAVDALDAAEAEQDRRRIAAEAVERSQRTQAAQQDLAAGLERYNEAFAEVRHATEQLIAAYARAHAEAAAMIGSARILGRSLHHLEPEDHRITLSRLLANALKGLGHRGHYGCIDLPSVEFFANDWTRHPAALAAVTASVIQGDQQ